MNQATILLFRRVRLCFPAKRNLLPRRRRREQDTQLQQWRRGIIKHTPKNTETMNNGGRRKEAWPLT
jgi:hypothetical protein